MTLTKIAKIAKTSVSTVSKAFSGSREIPEATRERIYRIAKELGCFDKYYKAPRKRPLLALIIPEIDSECYGTYTGIFEREFRRRGADTIIACTGFESEREAELFRELVYGMKVDGVLLWGSGELIRNPDEIPLIVFGKSYSYSNADSVTADFYSALLYLMKTVKDYGHTNVGFLGERLTYSKEADFKKAMRKVGLPIHEKYTYSSDKRFAEAGKEGMRTLIERGSLPSVIVTSYDQIAYGAMKYARENGYEIPEDISFVGMDDITAAAYFDVPLSSIHAGYEDICERVCDLVFERMKNRHYRSREVITVPITVNIRASLKSVK